MIQPSIDEDRLKEIVKQALTEILLERRDLFSELFSEVLEDIAMAKAIEEGEGTKPVSRDRIFKTLKGERGR